MGENQKRILQMLAEGKITVDEASRLLSLLGQDREASGEAATAEKASRSAAKFLYVKVEPKAGSVHAEHGRVNVRIPLALVRAGMKLTALVPPQVAEDVNRAMNEKGIRFDIRNFKDEHIEQLIGALSESEIDVDSNEATVRVYAE